MFSRAKAHGSRGSCAELFGVGIKDENERC